MNIVWVLGAGFSRSLGAPLLSGLLSPEAFRRVSLTYQLDAVTDLRRKDHFKHAQGIIELFESACWGLDHIKNNRSRLWEHAEEFIEVLDNIAVANARRSEITAQCQAVGGRCAEFFGGGGTAKPEMVRACAIRMLAAECCEFLDGVDSKAERWASYRDWADLLTENDTIITFNYDRVPNILAMPPGSVMDDPEQYKMWIPSPELARYRLGGGGVACAGPTVLKMHGSVDWVLDDGKIVRARETNGVGLNDVQEATAAAVFCHDEALAIATPGATKYRMISKGDGALRPIWEYAEKKIQEADQIVFLGYRIPPTDASTRKWFIENIRKNCDRLKDSEKLRILTVVGEDIESSDSRRLGGLLERTHIRVKVHRQPLRAEDFLALYRPGRLYEFYERTPGDYSNPPQW